MSDNDEGNIYRWVVEVLEDDNEDKVINFPLEADLTKDFKVGDFITIEYKTKAKKWSIYLDENLAEAAKAKQAGDKMGSIASSPLVGKNLV